MRLVQRPKGNVTCQIISLTVRLHYETRSLFWLAGPTRRTHDLQSERLIEAEGAEEIITPDLFCPCGWRCGGVAALRHYVKTHEIPVSITVYRTEYFPNAGMASISCIFVSCRCSSLRMNVTNKYSYASRSLRSGHHRNFQCHQVESRARPLLANEKGKPEA